MATSSFKEDLVLRDNAKVAEIATRLRQPRTSTVKAKTPPALPHNAGSIWFKRSEN